MKQDAEQHTGSPCSNRRAMSVQGRGDVLSVPSPLIRGEAADGGGFYALSTPSAFNSSTSIPDVGAGRGSRSFSPPVQFWPACATLGGACWQVGETYQQAFGGEDTRYVRNSVHKYEHSQGENQNVDK